MSKQAPSEIQSSLGQCIKPANWAGSMRFLGDDTSLRISCYFHLSPYPMLCPQHPPGFPSDRAGSLRRDVKQVKDSDGQKGGEASAPQERSSMPHNLLEIVWKSRAKKQKQLPAVILSSQRDQIKVVGRKRQSFNPAFVK